MYSLNNLGKIYDNKNCMFLKMYLNYFLRIVIRRKGYKNCMGSKNGNKHKKFPCLNNSGLDQIAFINILNLLYKETCLQRIYLFQA